MTEKPEVKPYQEELDLAFSTGHSEYLDGAKVKPGRILKVTHIAGSFANIATTEYVQLGYYNGHAYVELKKDKPAVASDFVHWDGEVYLREDQYIFAYFADVADGEIMKLRAQGRWE